MNTTYFYKNKLLKIRNRIHHKMHTCSLSAISKNTLLVIFDIFTHLSVFFFTFGKGVISWPISPGRSISPNFPQVTSIVL